MSPRFSLCGVTVPIPRLDSVIAADTSSEVPRSEGGGVGVAFLASRVTSQDPRDAGGEVV